MNKIIKKYFKRFIGLVNSCIPKYKKRVVIKSIPDFTGNAKAFSDYMVANQIEFEIIWIVENFTICPPSVRLVKRGSMQALWVYFTSKYVITTHNEMISTKALNQTYISLWHGMPFKKICYLGEYDYQGMEDYSSLRIATSEMMRSVISACFREKANNVYITGQPRNDFIFDSEISLEKLGIVGEFKTVVFYAPTFRENKANLSYSNGERIVGNNFIRTFDFDIQKLNGFFAEKEILLLLKLHPFEEKSFDQTNLASNIKIITSQLLSRLQLDVNHVLAISDILISDYSSVYFDFMIRDRPIIFLVPDKNDYSKYRGGFALEPFDFWTPGEKVTTQDELLKQITQLMNGEDHYSDRRKEINSIVNKFSDNQNCKRVFDTFFK